MSAFSRVRDRHSPPSQGQASAETARLGERRGGGGNRARPALWPDTSRRDRGLQSARIFSKVGTMKQDREPRGYRAAWPRCPRNLVPALPRTGVVSPSCVKAHAVCREGAELDPCREESRDRRLEFGLAAAVILKHVERRPTLGIERDDLTIDHGFVRELFQRPWDQCKALGKEKCCNFENGDQGGP
jgi:hypothetical protein